MLSLFALGVTTPALAQDAISDEGYVIETGRVVMQGPAAELAGNEDIRRAYLGG